MFDRWSILLYVKIFLVSRFFLFVMRNTIWWNQIQPFFYQVTKQKSCTLSNSLIVDFNFCQLECNLSDSTHIFAKPEIYVLIASLHYRNVLVLRSAVLPFDPFAWLPWNFYDVMTQCTCIPSPFTYNVS